MIKLEDILKEILEEENNPNVKLRIFVQGGGCSGMQYGFTFDEEQNEDDFIMASRLVNGKYEKPEINSKKVFLRFILNKTKTFNYENSFNIILNNEEFNFNSSSSCLIKNKTDDRWVK